MSQLYECVVPEMEWNLRQQRQEQVEEKQKRYHHQHYNNIDNNNSTSSPWFQQNLHPIMSSNDVQQTEELTWENGHLSMHGHDRDPTKPVWSGSKDTLESIVHQASHNKTNPIVDPRESISMMKKRARSESELQCGNTNYSRKGDHYEQQGIDLSLCGSGSATLCKDEDTAMMTWASFESTRSFKTSKTFDHAEDSASLGLSENQDEDDKTKTDQTGRSHSSRRSRVAANHNQSERRRRDRINQKMRALQRLVPNAYKTDKASMLDEVIEYLKQLQAQVETMISMRNMNVPQFTMMPLGIAQAQQQQLQLSLLSRMVGLGMGMSMLDPNSIARVVAAQAPPPHMHPATASAAAAATLISPQFARPTPPAVVPVAHPKGPEKVDAHNYTDPFGAFLAQNMNIDLYNKMASLYRQQQMGSPSTTHQMGRDQ